MPICFIFFLSIYIHIYVYIYIYINVHELLMAKFKHKLKKVGKTTRALGYDLNQIAYDYALWQIDSRD